MCERKAVFVIQCFKIFEIFYLDITAVVIPFTFQFTDTQPLIPKETDNGKPNDNAANEISPEIREVINLINHVTIMSVPAIYSLYTNMIPPGSLPTSPRQRKKLFRMKRARKKSVKFRIFCKELQFFSSQLRRLKSVIPETDIEDSLRIFQNRNYILNDLHNKINLTLTEFSEYKWFPKIFKTTEVKTNPFPLKTLTNTISKDTEFFNSITYFLKYSGDEVREMAKPKRKKITFS
ncbi:hypothetical protein ABEB36_000341 [Hypothenemus hampei]|uniref:Uncharacterized protein n=1 Tax=Hypothenemus hampei TaxID=57062 RepID=A0ABD1FEJ1_HYPHA